MFIWIQKFHSSLFTNDWVWCIAAAPLRMPSCRWICCSCCRLFSGSLSTNRNQKEPHPCCFHACTMMLHVCGTVGAVLAPSSKRRKLGGWSIQSCRGPPLCVEQLLREILEMTRKQIEKKQTEESNWSIWLYNCIWQKQVTTMIVRRIGDNQKLTLGSPSWTCLSFSDRSKRSLAAPLQL